MSRKSILKSSAFNFISMDCEGLCGAINLCEITMIKYVNGEYTELRTYRFRPYSFTGEVNNLDKLEAFNKLPTIVDKWTELTKFLQNSVVISHNFRGDLAWFKREIEHFNLKDPLIYGICSEKLSKVIFEKKAKKCSQLRKLCSSLGIPIISAKSSYSDADFTAKLYLKCLEKAPVATIEELLKNTDLKLYCSNGKKYNYKGTELKNNIKPINITGDAVK